VERIEESVMALWKKVTHREWQDWVGVGLGALTLVSPFIGDEPVGGIVMLNAVVIGLVVLMISQLEIVGPTSWEEIINAICGLWLIVSPLILGYSAAGQLRFWHFGLGALVTIIALVELWQDRQKAGA
jgi:hypothetical protein